MRNSTKQKILLLLLGGVALGFSYSPSQYYKTLRIIGRGWQKIGESEGNIKKEIKSLYKSKLVKEKKNKDGSFTLFLSDKGKVKALTYHFEEIKIETKNWDGKWRIVFFDIPEKYRWGRDALRRKLRELGFYELQKSVFAFPYECENEIDFIIEFYGIRKYVRYASLDYIDNDAYLRRHFSIK